MIFLTVVLAFVIVTFASTEASYQRDVFYVGGQYVYNATLGGTILINQQYVEELTPVGGVRQPHPIVFIHGGLSGTVSLDILCRFMMLIQSNTILARSGSISQTVVQAGRRTSSCRVTASTSSTSGVLDGQLVTIYPLWLAGEPWSSWSGLLPHLSFFIVTTRLNSTHNGQG